MTAKQIAFSEKSLLNTERLLAAVGADCKADAFPNPTFSNISLHSLDRQIKESYDLILVHPQSLSRSGTVEDAKTVESLIIKNKKNVIVRGNKDKNSDILDDLWLKLGGCIETVEKSKFLSLIKYADRFITNSSCSYYEAPLLLEESQIIRIGDRNNGREIVNYSSENIDSALSIADFIIK